MDDLAHDFSDPAVTTDGTIRLCRRCLGVTPLSVAASGRCPGEPFTAEAPFLGIDRTTEPTMAGTFSNAALSGPLTLEALEEGMRAIEQWKPPVPCGSDEKHPHITAPVGVGERAQCVNCGEWLVYTSEKRGVSIGGPGLFTEALFKPKWPTLGVIASDLMPPDRMFLLDTAPLTAAETEEMRKLMELGHDEVSAVASVRAKRALMIKVDV